MEIELSNYKGIQYIGQIAFGNKKEDKSGSDVKSVQTNSFVFDTGSSWTWLSTLDCKDEDGLLFNGSDCENGATGYFGGRSTDFYNHKLSKTYKQQIDN